MAVIILDDQRASNRDKKNDAGVSQGNERAWLFDSPVSQVDEDWAWNSEVGRFYNSVWNETRNAISPIATEVNNLNKIIEQIEAQIVVIGPSGTMKSARTGEDFDTRDFVLLEDRAIIVSDLVDEAIKLGVSLEPVTEAEANRLLREGGAVGVLESAAQEASAEITSILEDNEDIVKKWGALNQSGDAELARTALYEHDRKEFERVASTNETVIDKGVSGGIYQVDNTLSNQAFRLFRPQGSLLNYYSSLGVESFEATNARQALAKLNTFDREAQEARQVRFAEEDAAEAAQIEGLRSGFTQSQLRDPDTVPQPETVTEEVASPQTETQNQNIGDVWSAIDQATNPQTSEGSLDDPIFGPTGLGQTPSNVADTETPQQQIPTGPTPEQIMAEREADRDEIYSLLQEQFGGASYFFRQHATNMLLGVTADGTIVSYDDESAESQIGLMDYIVNNGITSMTRVKGLLQKTEWWQTTDVARRTYDVMWGEMSDPERKEFLEPTTDALTKEAQFLGFDLSEEDAFSLAQTLAQNGDSEDTEAIREMIIGQLANYEITNEFSDFSAGRDALEQLAYKYYVPQTEETAQDWAEKIYTGEATQTEYEQYLKATAVSRFPTLDKVINQMGITPDQYFSPYKYQIEQMLGRQVDMLDEFSDVIEYIPDAGTNARPMTLSEVRNFVRALPEWQQTDDAKDQARALSFSIGQTFGEVA